MRPSESPYKIQRRGRGRNKVADCSAESNDFAIATPIRRSNRATDVTRSAISCPSVTPRSTSETSKKAPVIARSSTKLRARSVKSAAAAAAVIGSTAVVAAVSPGIHDLSAFVAPSSSTIPTTPGRPSKKWNIVTPPPLTAKKRKQENASSDSVPSPAKKRTTKTATTPKKEVSGPRSQSFGPVTSVSYKSNGKEVDPNAIPVPIHTLILGTHPGKVSLQNFQYYAHPMNAFWWIAGDCLGFRRDTGVSPTSGKPYKFVSDLRHVNVVDSYEERLRILTSHGFALWDIVASCERPSSSLDSDIKKDQPNNIREFFNEHKHSLKRIVLANGSSGLSFFKKHFKSWMDESSDELVLVTNENLDLALEEPTSGSVLVIPALAVSPAAAVYSYAQKRDFWDRYVYQPGLENLRSQKSNKVLKF